ncbi:hypothetical protein LTR66_015912, partial [Elasticomyces elasticus]
MAPGLIETRSIPADNPGKHINVKPVDRNIFPDGFKTSGQHPPLRDQLYSYSSFPKYIEGTTVWQPTTYQHSPEKWVHQFTTAELNELSLTAVAFLSSSAPLTGITKSDFSLPTLAPILASIKDTLLNGPGFVLFKGIPVEQWGNHKSAVAYLILSSHLGYPVSQNGRGHILGHVKDLGEDSTQIDKVRIYRTNARQFFHADDADLVGLLCIARAHSGGESDVASVHEVWNILQAERPDIAELLTQDIWYVDRKGEVSVGEEPYIRTAVFYLETPDPATPSRTQRVYCKWDPYYVRSLTRFSDKGIIPPLSAAQKDAIDVLEAICDRVKLHMILEVGDIQFV